VIDRQQIIVDNRALGGMRPRQAVNPPAMRAHRTATVAMQAAPQQQLAQAMPTAV
jgi:hypothetical protein